MHGLLCVLCALVLHVCGAAMEMRPYAKTNFKESATADELGTVFTGAHGAAIVHTVRTPLTLCGAYMGP